jgi:hypothetical protein
MCNELQHELINRPSTSSSAGSSHMIMEEVVADNDEIVCKNCSKISGIHMDKCWKCGCKLIK